MAKKTAMVGRGAHCKELAALLRDNARHHRLHGVFSDFCEMAALSISNAVDKRQFDKREARYMQIVARYEPEEIGRFPRMLAVLVDWLECGFADCLGELFMALELGDHWKGQFFTPYSVSSLMAGITLGDVRPQIERQGFVTISEPACGAGAMVIACADVIHAQSVNYQQAMHVTAVDVDATAVHMAYLQFSLLHIPAIVVHGNSLSLAEWAHWVTPAHVLGGWDRRLRLAREASQAFEVPELTRPAAEPTPAVLALPEIRATVVAQRERDQLSLFG